MGLVEVKPLEGPFEISELRDRQSLELKPIRWELGTVVIHPRYPGAPAEKEIRALRLHVAVEEKPLGVPYYDLTSQTLIAQLVPLLPGVVERGGKIRIQAFGVAPSKRFQVTVL